MHFLYQSSDEYYYLISHQLQVNLSLLYRTIALLLMKTKKPYLLLEDCYF